jgi:transcription factor MBP1
VDNDTIISESMMDDNDLLQSSQYSLGGSRKRKRDQISLEDQQHQMWADSLLDYFMLLESDDRFPAPPEPPPNVDLNRPIDEKGHSAIHWAAAMGDVDVVKDLIRRGARIDCTSTNLETPLMRAVMFTNNYDKNTMPSIAKMFHQTVHKTDWFDSTVFHHIAATTSSANKYVCARYYLDCIINKLTETWNSDEITRLLNFQDKNGDTAVHIAARNGARKLVRALLGRNVDVGIANEKRETADELIRDLNERRRHIRPRQASSSPFAPVTDPRLNGDHLAPQYSSMNSLSRLTTSQHTYRSQTASHLMEKIAPTLLDKCSELATAYEAELVDKEVELTDAERVRRRRETEIEVIRRQITDLEHQIIAFEAHDDVVRENELMHLVAESEALSEIEQRTILRRERAQAEQRAMAVSGSSQTMTAESDPDELTDEALNERFHYAMMLYRAQTERQQLVRQVVQALSTAGMGERTTDYKKLITAALGVKEDDVENMLPEILAELQENTDREVMDGGTTMVRGLEEVAVPMI